MKDAQWTATVDNGSGSLGRIANVEFGNSDSEILVFSGFGGLLTVWSLLTGRTIEIKDAKFTTKGYDQSRSTNSAIFALLTRPAAQDIITLHASNSYAVLKSYILPTSDAQGLKWSPNGRWLAVWDTPANGIKIHIYTADGNLYRTYVGGDHVDELVGLGVKSIEWSSDGEYLVVAGHEKDIVLLSTRTVSVLGLLRRAEICSNLNQFCVAVRLTYKSTLRPDSVCIWQEQPTLSTSRSYATATKPIILSTAHAPAPENRPSFGASIMTFNSGSSLLATKDDNMPTTVWIWDLALMKLRVAIIQNSVVKRLSWHPKKRNLLLIQTSQPEANLHIWDADVNQPHIIAHPSSLRLGNKAEAEWAVGGQQITPTIIYGGADGCVFAWPEGRRFRHGVTTQHEDPEVASDEEDSLYAILSGQESTPKADDTQAITEGAVDFPLEDTFQFRKDIGVH